MGARLSSGSRQGLAAIAVGAAALLIATAAEAHGIGGSDAAFVRAAQGPEPFAFGYLGAKHMVTGYDHLLFLTGVIFFLFRLRQIALYVTLFSLGHSLTLLAGVAFDLGADPHLVDAVIGLSVAYKAFDNLGGFRTVLGVRLDARAAVFGFGLVHGLGLATKLQALRPNREGLLENLVAFNVGVEIGQLIALSLILGAMTVWRRAPAFARTATLANAALMTAGFVLAGQQVAAFFWEGGE